MNATELFKAGKLQEAIDAQIQEVKEHPTDPALRIFLFELASFAGDLDRARRQIEAARYDEPDLMAAVARYFRVLESEKARRATFVEGQAVSFLGEIPFHARMRADAVRNMLPNNLMAEARSMLTEARNVTPNLHVMINGKEYEGLNDLDDIFGTLLEVYTNGLYYWIPLEQVSTLAMNEPKFPRDLLWIPARLEMADGQSGEVFLPTIYPGSHRHPDDQVKLGRATDWKTLEDGPTLGAGQRSFLAGEDELGILEWREVRVLGEIPRQG